jgi:hypothetical protein
MTTGEEFIVLLADKAAIAAILEMGVGGLWTFFKPWIITKEEFKKRNSAVIIDLTQSLATTHQSIIENAINGNDYALTLATWTQEQFDVIKKVNELNAVRKSYGRCLSWMLSMFILGILFTLFSFLAGGYNYLITLPAIACVLIEIGIVLRMVNLIGKLESYEK